MFPQKRTRADPARTERGEKPVEKERERERERETPRQLLELLGACNGRAEPTATTGARGAALSATVSRKVAITR